MMKLTNISLGMYLFEEIDSLVRKWETELQRHLEDVFTERKINEGIFEITQTCGWPLISSQRSKFRALAVPRYNAEGCEGHNYSSVLVVRHEEAENFQVEGLRKRTAAINSMDSCSGSILLADMLGPEIFSEIKEHYTGSHVKSLECIKEGSADFAAIDCVTWALLEKFRPKLTEGLSRVLGSRQYLALPYVTRLEASEDVIGAMKEAVSRAISDEKLRNTRESLLIGGFETSDDLINLTLYEKKMENILRRIRFPQTCLQANEDKIRDMITAQHRFDAEMLRVAQTAIKKSIGRKANEERFVVFEMENGCKARILFPGGKDHDPWTEIATRNCVGFFGTRVRPHEFSRDFNLILEQCWEVDVKITENMDPDLVSAYATLETQPGGDYYNLVVFNQGKSAGNFGEKTSDGDRFHEKAVTEIAPGYYSRVRIHRLSMTSEGGVTFQRSLAIRFQNGSTLQRNILYF